MSRRAWLLFAALSVIWGLPYFLIKICVAEMSPGFVVAGRLVLAAAILVAIARARGGGLSQLAGYWPAVALLAAVEIAIPFGLLAWAETEVTSSLAGLMIAAVPAISAALAAALGLADRLDRTRLLGLAIGLVGVAALVGLDLGTESALAVLALIGTAVGYAVGPIVLNTRLVGPPGPTVMAAATTIAAVAYAPALVLAWPRQPVSAPAWWSLAALGAVCTAAGFLLLFALVAEAGPTRMTVITYLNPVVATFLGVVVLHEPLTAGILLGFPLILLGSVLATRPSATTAGRPPVGVAGRTPSTGSPPPAG